MKLADRAFLTIGGFGKMTSGLILGLDLGTQAIKGVLVNTQGDVVFEASFERHPRHPQPGWTEMDAEQDWWLACVHVIRNLLSCHKDASNLIQAIGVTALACCLCPLDKYGQPLRPAILYSDNRAIDELTWVNQLTGLSLSAEAVVPKLVWLRRHEPEVFERMMVTVTANGYVVYRLTGRLSMDYDNASIMGGIFDTRTHQWKEEVLRVLGLPVSIWPKPLPVTGIVGEVSAEAAQMTGLKPGIPVIAGTGDTFPTIVGCGAINPGDAMISFGTTGLLTLTVRPLVEAIDGPHFQSDSSLGAVKWGANVLSAGRMVQWFREQFAHAERLVAERSKISEFLLLENQARLITPGADGLIILFTVVFWRHLLLIFVRGTKS
jgi:xylulokinase